MLLHQQYVIDEKGHRAAVIVPYSEWEKILDILEEYDDISLYDAAKKEKSDPISLKAAIKMLGEDDDL